MTNYVSYQFLKILLKLFIDLYMLIRKLFGIDVHVVVIGNNIMLNIFLDV